jgi:hypothetical protein
LDFDLLGCPVTDVETGEVVGRVKVVVQSPTPGRIAQLALERLTDGWAREAMGAAPAMGEPLYDGRGVLLGWAVGMAESLPGGGMRRLGEAGPFAGGTRFLLVREQAEGEGAVIDGHDLGEGDSAHGDYMVGQTAACTLIDPQGQTVIRHGEVITADVLERARRLGLLHRLEATF